MSIAFLEANEERFIVPAKRQMYGRMPKLTRYIPNKPPKPTIRMRTPIAQLTAAELHAILLDLATKAAEYIRRPKRSKKRLLDDEPPEESTGITLYNAEVAIANDTRKGPYLAMAEVIASMLTPKPKASLSTTCIEHQYGLLRANFAVMLESKKLDELLNEASCLAYELFSQLVVGWKQDIESSTACRVSFEASAGATADAYWNWNPTKLTYRVLSVLNGDHVSAYKSDFVWDFYDRSATGKATDRKSNPLAGHSAIESKLAEILQPRDEFVRHSNINTSSNAPKKRRHPCVGPLEFEDYYLHKSDIHAVYEQSAHAEAAATRLQATSIPIEALVCQHEFEIRFTRLCQLVISAFVEYNRVAIFGTDVASLHGIFCLTAVQNNVGDKFEDTNCKEGWYVRLLNRIMMFDDPDLKTKNYKPFTDVSESTEQRRHPTSRSTEQVFLQMSGRLSGWVESEFMKNLTTFYLTRARAFEHSGLFPVETRDKRLKMLSISRNEIDSFDDLVRSRRVTDHQPAECLTSWRTPGSLTEEANLMSDAVTLAIVVVGREAACRDFPDAVHAAGIVLPTADDTNLGELDEVGPMLVADTELPLEPKPRGRTPAERLERLEYTEDLMSNWLALRQRCDQKTLMLRIQGALAQLRTALWNVENCVRLTRLVANEYQTVRQEQFAIRARIMNMDDDVELSADDRILKDRDMLTEERECVQMALTSVFKTMKYDSFCTSRASLAVLVGAPPAWNWETDPHIGDNTTIPQSTHAIFVRGLDAAFKKYADYIGSCRESTAMIDFVSPLNAYLQMLLAPKTITNNDDGCDWVGFSESIARVRASRHVLECLTMRINKLVSSPTDFIAKLCEVTHYGFHIALEWAGVLSPNAVHLRPHQTPRKEIAIAHILKVLSVAYAHDAVRADSDIHMFRVTTNRIEIGTVEDLLQFAKTSVQNWACLCTIAELTKCMLVYNREVTFDPFDDAHMPCYDGAISVSFCKDIFLTVHIDAMNAHRRDLAAYRASIVSSSYPPVHDWTFHDSHWSDPRAFHVLLEWLPSVAHDVRGFFPISGVRERPDRLNGFLNVSLTLHYPTNVRLPQFWDSFYTHPAARTHGRLPTPPGLTAPDNDDGLVGLLLETVLVGDGAACESIQKDKVDDA